MPQSEYAKAGVDYTVMEPFKQAMIAAGKRTLRFPEKREVYINEEVMHAHGGVFEYRGTKPHMWCNTEEGLGNKNWIAEWMYQNAPSASSPQQSSGQAGQVSGTYYEGIGIDTALMGVNDVVAQGAMPVVFTDEVAVGDAAWYGDTKRSAALAESFYKVCEEVGMALPAGESPALKYLMKPEPPVTAAPSLSGCVTGILAPKDRLITGAKLALGDHIIAAASSGIHANGISLVIKRALELPEKFLTKLPDGRMLGEHALIPTRSYVALVEVLQENSVDIHALLPGTGDGLGKLAYDKRPFSYRVHSWLTVPPLFQFFREAVGVSLMDCLKTFNWGAGYYVFVSAADAARVVELGEKAGYTMMDVGTVEEGKRQVVFEPENITLAPPGE